MHKDTFSNAKFPILSQAERYEILECFSLDKFQFQFTEWVGKTVLRSRLIRGREHRFQLFPMGNESQSPLVKEELAHVHLFWGDKLPRQAPNHPWDSLWELIFPRPFNLLSKLFLIGHFEDHIIGPRRFCDGVKALWEAMHSLEVSLLAQEVAYLEIVGLRRQVSLITKSSYHKFVSVRSGALLNTDQVSDQLGRVARFHLDFSELPTTEFPLVFQYLSEECRRVRVDLPSREEDSDLFRFRKTVVISRNS